MSLGDDRPGKLPCPEEPGGPTGPPALRRAEHAGETFAERSRIPGGDEHAGALDDVGKRTGPAGHHRNAGRHRLDDDPPELLEPPRPWQGWDRQHVERPVRVGQFLGSPRAGEVDPPSQSELLREGLEPEPVRAIAVEDKAPLRLGGDRSEEDLHPLVTSQPADVADQGRVRRCVPLRRAEACEIDAKRDLCQHPGEPLRPEDEPCIPIADVRPGRHGERAALKPGYRPRIAFRDVLGRVEDDRGVDPEEPTEEENLGHRQTAGFFVEVEEARAHRPEEPTEPERIVEKTVWVLAKGPNSHDRLTRFAVDHPAAFVPTPGGHGDEGDAPLPKQTVSGAPRADDPGVEEPEDRAVTTFGGDGWSLRRALRHGRNLEGVSTPAGSVGQAPPGRSTGALRIAVVSNYLPTSSKIGVGHWVDQFARELARRGHDVVIFSAAPAVPGAPYEVVTVPVGTRGRTFRFALELRHIDWTSFDVVHAHGDDYLLFGRPHPPHIRTMHGSCLEEALHVEGAKERLRMLALGVTELLSTAVADETVVVSPATRRWMPWVRRVVPPGVDLGRFQPSGRPRSTQPSILFVGTYRRRKRGSLLVEAFADVVHPALPEAELWMVAEDVPPAPGVVRLGRVSDETLVALYHAAWVFALPSSYEGFGIPYLEAQAAGVPVVATPNPGARYVLDGGRAGLLVEDADLGATLLHLLTDDSERDRLSAAGLARSRELGLSGVVDTYEQIYRSLLAARAGGRR